MAYDKGGNSGYKDKNRGYGSNHKKGNGNNRACNGGGNDYRGGQKDTVEENFYNPYSFVPLNRKVLTYSKEEREMLGHDVPFSDGYCGTIEVKMKAESPFCIKTSRDDSHSYRTPDGKFFIPGSSIRGMFRNVLEVLALCDMRNSTSNDRYSFRDLSKGNDDYELKKGEQKAGFLIKFKNEFRIFPCKKSTISYHDIERKLNVPGIGYDIKNANEVRKKYSVLSRKNLNFFIKEGKETKFFVFCKKADYIYTIPDFSNERYYVLKDKNLEDFLFIHNVENKNASWEFWEERLKKGISDYSQIASNEYKDIVPCFFRTEKKGNEMVVRDLGFSKLYRQPYKYTLHDCIKVESSGLDFAQGIFGYTDENGNESLKGRVRFSDALLEGASEGALKIVILGRPKPTFYPFYLQQNKNNTHFVTYSSKDAVVSGWKRYLVRNQVVQGNSAVVGSASKFFPLNAGATFTCKIYVHNLRDFELGALLCAITLDGNYRTAFHQLGYAKPYGYGKMKISDVKLDLSPNKIGAEVPNLNNFVDSFKTKISKESLTEEFDVASMALVRLASGSYEKTVRYPKFPVVHKDGHKDPNEFDAIKKSNRSIENFSPRLDK